MTDVPALRSFPILYVANVNRSAAFYGRLGYEPYFRFPDTDEPGYVGMRRGDSYLGVTTDAIPQDMFGRAAGSGPRFELFTYVDDVDATVTSLRDAGVEVLREPEDMPWGERIAYVSDPDGNPVTLAAPSRLP
jgi:lactoylglutathione lyase